MNVVVTGGGTIAPIDDVRSIANVSTGRFSAAITEACLRRGATVWHIHTPTALLPYQRLASFDLDTTDPVAESARIEKLLQEWRNVRDRLHRVSLHPGTVADYSSAMEHLFASETIDVAFLAIAVSDYEPLPVAGKIDSSGEKLVIPCKKTPKVIRSVRDWAPDVYLAGFKLMSGATTSALIREAEIACKTNRADLTVANDLSTLREGRHTVHLVRSSRETETLRPSPDLADMLVERVFTFASAIKNKA